MAAGTVEKKDIEIVSVDTTVQEKAIRFPTDTHLCHKAREFLVGLANTHSIALRQSYGRKEQGKNGVPDKGTQVSFLAANTEPTCYPFR